MRLFLRKWAIAAALCCCLGGSIGPADAQYNVAAEQGYKRARTMASNERWDDALTALSDVLKKAPNYPDALYLAGVCHLSKGDYANAEKRLKRLTEICKDFIGGWGMLANVYLATKQYDKIKDIIVALGKIKGGKAEAYYFSGLLAYMKNDLGQAERDWRNATVAQPDMAKAHYNLGSLMYTKGDRVRAMQGLKDALRYDPENPLYRYSLAALQLEIGSKAEGMKNLDRVRQQTLRKDIAHLAAALQMWNNGHSDKAEKLALQAIGDNKDLSEAYLLRAKALEKLGRTDEALISYKKALEGDPNYKEAQEAIKRLTPSAPAGAAADAAGADAAASEKAGDSAAPQTAPAAPAETPAEASAAPQAAPQTEAAPVSAPSADDSTETVDAPFGD
ncbi:tetratricopeptide repeat protein [bacterium]|nr:tetratricopeptide repeat protein [bacterium]